MYNVFPLELIIYAKSNDISRHVVNVSVIMCDHT